MSHTRSMAELGRNFIQVGLLDIIWEVKEIVSIPVIGEIYSPLKMPYMLSNWL